MGFDFQILVLGLALVAVIGSVSMLRGIREDARRPSGWADLVSRGAQDRTGTRAVVLVCCALLAIAAPSIFGLNGMAQAAVGFVGLLLAPGAVVVLFLRLRDPLTEIAIAAAVSMAVLALLAQILLAVGAWDPIVAFRGVLLLTAPLLTWHACMAVGYRTLLLDGQGRHARA